MRAISGSPSHPAATGAVSGMVAAVMMAMLATVVSATQGAGVFEPVQLIGATFVDEATTRPILAIVVGVVLHLMVGAGLGALFGLVTARVRSAPLLVAAGICYAAVVFVVMTYAVLPLVNPTMAASLHPGWFYVYHLAFGLALSLSILVVRARVGRDLFADAGPPRHSHG